MSRRLSRLFIGLLLLVLVIAGCGQSQAPQVASVSQQQAETTLQRVKREGIVRVGFANEVPFAYAKPDGTLTGEAVEVARAVFKRMGVETMEGVLVEFGGLIPGLQANRFDAITAGMFIKPERCEQVLFAEPEYSIGAGLLVKAGNPHGLRSYEDIAAKSEVKLGVMTGAYEAQYAAKTGVKESQIVNLPDNPAGVDALLAGRIDVLTGNGPSLQAVLETAGSSEIERVMDFKDPVIDGEQTRGYGAAAFRKSDTEFRDAFNKELQALKESGELLTILQPFGFTQQELPGSTTTAQLCQGK